ncbi:MAG: ribonuclease R [Bacteroidota bacterium]
MLKQRILDFFAHHPNESFKSKELARRLSIRDEDDYRNFRTLLHSMSDAEEIQRLKGRRYTAVKKKSTITGILRVTKQGFGFVLDDNGEEAFVSQRFMGTALDGDTVVVSLFAVPMPKKGGKPPQTERREEGEIIRILHRARTTVVGKLTKTRNFFFVIPDDARVRRDIYIPRQSLDGAKNGDKVVIQLEPWESEHLNPEGRVIEILGRAGDPSAELLSVARAFDLRTEFPRDVVREAQNFSAVIPRDELAGRKDCRPLLCFTIDPENARDFDDAVSLEHLPDGTARLGVHIADVGYYVREGSALDSEALRRGTSVYLANSVIPMLPEHLSNDLCSLQPHKDRLTYSVFMNINPRGTVQEYEIVKSIISSKRRFTYEEVQKIIDQGKGEFDDTILAMHRLSTMLTKKRMREGSIDFEAPEAQFRFDEDGYPVEIIKKTRLDSHRLIEEFMLLANKTAARHIGVTRSNENQNPFIYRVHDVPDPGKLKDLATFVANFGYKLNPDHLQAKDLQKLLESVKGTEEEYVINDVAIRSMAKAIYSEKNIGHFGLGFRHYSQFTSPIRRYPDLFIHRLLQEYAVGMTAERRTHFTNILPNVCLQCSETERKAADAERESVKIKQVEYMDRHIGDELHGIVSGVSNFGIFVEINDLLIEGMVRVRDMEDDYYMYDEKKYALIGRHTGKRYRIGDKVKVQVISVSIENREVDFTLVS